MRDRLTMLHAWVDRTWQTFGAYLQVLTGCALIALTIHTWTLAADVSAQDEAARAAARQACEHRQAFGPFIADHFAQVDALPPPVLDAYRESIPDECP